MGFCVAGKRVYMGDITVFGTPVGDSFLYSGFQVRREAPLPPLPLSEQPRVDVSDLVRPADLLLGSFGPVTLRAGVFGRSLSAF